MKKRIVFIFSVLMLLLLSSCIRTSYNGPAWDANYIWLCDEYPIYWLYDEEKSGTGFSGHTTILGENTGVLVQYGLGSKRRVRISIDIPKIDADGKYQGRSYSFINGNCQQQRDDLQYIVVDHEASDNRIEIDSFYMQRYTVDEIVWVDGWPVPNTKAND